jgi:hypothetical protein
MLSKQHQFCLNGDRVGTQHQYGEVDTSVEKGQNHPSSVWGVQHHAPQPCACPQLMFCSVRQDSPDKAIYLAQYVTCVEQVQFTDLVFCCVLCSEWFGVHSGLLRGASLREGITGAGSRNTWYKSSMLGTRHALHLKGWHSCKQCCFCRWG